MDQQPKETTSSPFWARYRRRHLLGRGASGSVHLAEDIVTGDQVAVKCCRPEWSSQAAQEAAILAGIRFPGVVRLRDATFDTDLGSFVAVFDFIHGQDLFRATEGLPLHRVAHLLADVLRALAFVHRKGIVHRDLKPENLLVAESDGLLSATVIDFGLAAGAADSSDRTGGTLSYLAPEVLSGEVADHRSDLYSFGIVLYQILVRGLPGAGLSGIDVARLHLAGDLTLPDRVVDRLPAGLVDLVHTLLRRDPAVRISAASEVLESLARSLGMALDLETNQTLVGRSRSILFPVADRLRQRLEQHGRGSGALLARVPPGSEPWLAGLRVSWASNGRVVLNLSMGSGARVMREPDPRAIRDGGVAFIECGSTLSSEERLVLDAWLEAAADDSRGLAVVVVVRSGGRRPTWLDEFGLDQVELPHPSENQVLELIDEALGVAIPSDQLRRLRVQLDYSPRSVVEGLSNLVDTGILVAEGELPGWNRSLLMERSAPESSVQQAAEIVRDLPESDRRFLEALALSRVPVPAVVAENLRVDLGSAPLVSLVDRALVVCEPDTQRVATVSEALSVALVDRLSPDDLRALSRRVAELLLDSGDLDAEGQGEAALLLVEADSVSEAVPLLIEAGIRLRTGGRASEARRYLERALEFCPAGSASGNRLQVLRWLADSESLEGHNAEALRLAQEAVSLEGDPEDLVRAHVVLARTQMRMGDTDRSAATLDAGLAVQGIESSTRALLLTTRSMLHRQRREHEAAVLSAQEALAAVGAEPSLERGAALMTLANAQADLGLVDEAVSSYREAEGLGRDLGREEMTALAVANVGRVLCKHGRVSEALQILRPVLDGFERSGSIRHAEGLMVTLIMAMNSLGDISGARELGLKGRSFFGDDSSQVNRSMFLLHLAESELRAGNSGEAERLVRESVRIREAVSSRATLSSGLSELSRVLVWQDRTDEARISLARALRCARIPLSIEALGAASQVAAGLHRFEGRSGAALFAARRALRCAEKLGMRRQLCAASAQLCITLLEHGEVREILEQAEELFESGSEPLQDGSVGLLLSVRAAAFGMLQKPAEADAEFDSALAALVAEGHAFERAQALLMRGRYRLERAVGGREDVSSKGIRKTAELLTGARSDIHEAGTLFSSLGHRAGARIVQKAQAEFETMEHLGGATKTSFLGLEQRLRAMERLLELNKDIHTELDPQRLLNFTLDEAIALCGARRGFLILVQGTGINVRVARNFAEQDIQHPEFEFSHSVARQVALSGEPIQTSNALHDQRLRSIASIAELRVTSILCVPLRSQDQILGSIYLDHPDVIDRFDESDLDLLSDFASAAGIALERARLLQENIERADALALAKQEIERLNDELMETVEDQARELDETKDTLEAERRATALRYDYRNIITQSSRMQEVLRLLDRITETDFPVLIQGESGTGKELVAKAVHYNGPRARENFVSVNCAAMAEPLIEAELFGYMKGAFTGADRDRKGLFEIADGGTLFLDEIGDMSLEVQKRLLRVVQYGEFYRVGGKLPVNVNVRLISATHRDLKELMKKGQFREDLFYRISVAPVSLPPIRERDGDVPLLIQHFVTEIERSGPGLGKTFESEAMDALERYRWPGNVREIQNEVKRLLFLRTDLEAIGLEELPSVIREAAAASAAEPGVGLKEMMEDHERRIVQETLKQAGGNKTEAARRLGVSLRGFYKILERVGLSGATGGATTPVRKKGKAGKGKGRP